MGRPRNYSDAEVLERAIDVFWANGFEGTSITDLVAQLGINRSTMYAFFGDKEALYHRALVEYARRLAADREAEMVCPGDPLAGISRWLRSLSEGAANDTSRRGCFIGAAALERLPQHADTLSIVEADLAHTQRLITECLVRARDHGQLRDDLDITAAAALLHTLAQGIRILAKADPRSPTAALAFDTALSTLTRPA